MPFKGPLFLCLETSTPLGSVAIFEGEKLRCCLELQLSENTHAKSITIMVQYCLHLCNITLANLSAIVCAIGPGSYTGLRIGLSTAKGFCYATGLPLITIPTLAGIASAAIPFAGPNSLICPMVDARRMEVYTALYNTQLTEIQAANALVVSDGAFSELLAEREVWFLGDGAEKCRAILELNPNARMIKGIEASARNLGILANRFFNDKLFADLAYSVPFYLKQANVG